MSSDRVYLLHIQEAIGWILEYTTGGEEAFFEDKKTQDAVLRNLEVIGEAVKNRSPELQKRYPDVPWKRIAGMRDQLIHGYFGVDLHLVYDTVRSNLPELEKRVEEILGGTH